MIKECYQDMFENLFRCMVMVLVHTVIIDYTKILQILICFLNLI